MSNLAPANPGPNQQPILISLEGKDIRAWLEDGQPMWFGSVDLGKAIGLSQPRMANIVKELATEDRGIRFANTPGGRQKITVLSRSGVYQVIAQLQDKELGRRLRKWLADLGVAYETGKLNGVAAPATEPCLTRADLIEFGQTLIAGFAQAFSPRPRVKAFQPNQLTRSGRAEMQRKKFATAAAFLVQETGLSRQLHGVVPGLTTRCVHFAEEHCAGQEVFFRYTDGTQVVTYISLDVLKLIYRSGWRKGEPNPLHQDLFGQDGRPKLRALPGGPAPTGGPEPKSGGDS